MCTPNADGLFIADRREGRLWVLVGQDGRQITADGLPDGVCEGMAGRFSENGWRLCPEESREIRARVEEKKNRIFHRKK